MFIMIRLIIWIMVLKVDTLLSNDSGVAFIVKTKEGTIYHAGDLNDWYWDGEPKADNQRLTSAYHAEIRKIKGMHFDAVFVPPRSETGRSLC